MLHSSVNEDQSTAPSVKIGVVRSCVDGEAAFTARCGVKVEFAHGQALAALADWL